MAKKKKSDSGENLDWYLISIDRLKQIGLVVLILLLGGAGYWFWQKEKGNPKTNAEAAIADAKQALNALAASKEFNQHRAEFDRAQQKLDEANTLFAAAKYPDAQGAAVESQTISRTAVSGESVRENDAQFLTVEGDVKFQKGSAGDWKDAEPRGALFNGDWVKTGNRASAELIFQSNGSLYTIGPNALLEIYAVFNPQTSKKNNAVQVRVGSVEVATTDDASSVHTKDTNNRVVVEPESTALVGVDTAKSTAVVNTRGTINVITPTGQQASLTVGDKVTANPQGALSPVKKLSMPPALLSPADNQTFQLASAPRVEFVWDEQPGVSRYVLQVSRSRLFSTLEINTPRQKATAAAKVTEEGNFYWRVASVGADGETGPFSSFRRFRVAGGGPGKEPGGDTAPPVLTMKTPFHMGGVFYTIAGTTEPGATVFINDEEVDVETDGTFQKLVTFTKVGANTVVIKANDAAGNQTTKNQTVVVED